MPMPRQYESNATKQQAYRTRLAAQQADLAAQLAAAHARLATLEGQRASRPRDPAPAGRTAASTQSLAQEALPEELLRALEAHGQVYTQDLVTQALWHYLACPPAPRDAATAATRALTEKILAQFCDGKFHLVRTIATAANADMTVVRDLCNRLIDDRTSQTWGERRPAAPAQGSFAYRFVKGGNKTLNLSAFYAEVQPVLDDMDKVINGHRVDFSRQAMQEAFARFRKVIDRVAR